MMLLQYCGKYVIVFLFDTLTWLAIANAVLNDIHTLIYRYRSYQHIERHSSDSIVVWRISVEGFYCFCQPHLMGISFWKQMSHYWNIFGAYKTTMHTIALYPERVSVFYDRFICRTVDCNPNFCNFMRS